MGRTLDLVWSGGRVDVAGDDGFAVECTVGEPLPSGRRDVRVHVRYLGPEPVVTSVRFRVPMVTKYSSAGMFLILAFSPILFRVSA